LQIYKNLLYTLSLGIASFGGCFCVLQKIIILFSKIAQTPITSGFAGLAGIRLQAVLA
jgi:hypothetical protein